MTLNRSIAPVSYQTETLKLPAYSIEKLDNNLPVFKIAAGEQPVVKIEFIFDAGTRFENQNGQSFFAVKMLSEGTKTHTSAEIASFFDQFGASLELVHGVDRSGLSVYTLTKHLPAILPMIHSLIYESIFPEAELVLMKNIVGQNLKVQQEKTSYMAGQLFKETIFGLQHPAGVMLTDAAIQSISRDEIVAFYEAFWLKNQFKIFISGSFQASDLTLLNTIFGQKSILKPAQNQIETPQSVSQAILIEKEGSLQSSIRLGRPMFSRSHPDFFPFIVMNEAFGGYFGSRLMKNIREDKGFTYGISASLVPFTEMGYWIIGTDVKREFTQQTLDEIAKEINVMQTELIDEEELQTVKNYMIGAMAGGLNTPFEVADRVKVMIMNHLPDDFYANYIKNIRSISPAQIQAMAQKYLTNLTEIVVGGK
jgi:zinc protease